MFQFPRVVFPLFVNMVAAYSCVRQAANSGLKARCVRSSFHVPYAASAYDSTSMYSTRRSVTMMAAESDHLSPRKKRKLSKHLASGELGSDGMGRNGGRGDRGARIICEPRTPNQRVYVDALNDPAVPVVFGIGPAGSGKTMFACLAAVNALKSGAVSRIVMTRPVVSVDEQLGFLPGDIQRKMDPWVRPLFDVLLESSFSQVDIDRMIAHGVIEIAPLGFMRGRTFKHTFVLADELQNSTPSQMMMLLTRIGTGCKMVVTGDVYQSDLRGVNGLADFMDKFRRSSMGGSDIALCELDSGDIQRSAVVQRVHDMYSIPSSTQVPSVIESMSSSSSTSETKSRNVEDAAMIPYTSLPKHRSGSM